ncbi:hypothetical protein Moror_9680 [Moniliophthora roreri MCA 2997]|uniref:DUF7587 domain-containing protein n=2 Tax=Moniliophthora roreri TaxID=221103 RepID=V2X1N7_MONRO|nr:hypothetical protein Moror_9680 [Moniliophthora roreri MCA 2997]
MAPSIPPPAPPLNSTLLFRVLEYQDPAVRDSQLCGRGENLNRAQLEDLMAEHVRYWARAVTPFRSTSRAFIWALWEAWRRVFKLGMDPGSVEILIIDHIGLPDSMIHALSEEPIINSPKFQNNNNLKGRVTHAREVLIQGGIPDKNIIARVSWSKIHNRLPQFFDLNAELEKDYRLRFKDCSRLCRERGRGATLAEIETFIYEVFRPELSRRASNPILIDEYVYILNEHLFTHIFVGDDR